MMIASETGDVAIICYGLKLDNMVCVRVELYKSG